MEVNFRQNILHFGSNTLNNNYDYYLFFERGTVGGSYTISTNSYVGSKLELDYNLTNNAYTYINDYGAYLGYSFYFNDAFYLSFNTQVTYLAIGNNGQNGSSVLNSYLVSSDLISNDGYNYQLVSPYDAQFELDSFNNDAYDSFYDKVISPVTYGTFNAFFDYRNSKNVNTNYIRGEDYFFYNSYFELYEGDAYDYSNSYVLATGFDTSASMEYNKGYENGYATGRTNGYDEGYDSGYYNGYLTAKNENQASSTFFTLMGNAVETFTPVFSLEVLPNITLGTVISIPIICSLLVIIFRIARG